MMHTTGSLVRREVVENSGKYVKPETTEFRRNTQFVRNAENTPREALMGLKK